MYLLSLIKTLKTVSKLILLVALWGFAVGTLLADRSPVTASCQTFDLNRCRVLLRGDLTGNGREDIICPYFCSEGNYSATFVKFFTDQGFTDWQLLPGQRNFPLENCKSLILGNFSNDNGDRPDLLCVYQLDGGLSDMYVQIWQGSNFSPWQSWLAQPEAFDLTACEGMFAADLNGNGFTDIVCPYSSKDDQLVAIYVNFSDGQQFTGWQQVSKATAGIDLSHCARLAVFDIDGDEFPDLICYPPEDSPFAGQVWVQINDGEGNFKAWVLWNTGNHGLFPQADLLAGFQVPFINFARLQGDQPPLLVCLDSNAFLPYSRWWMLYLGRRWVDNHQHLLDSEQFCHFVEQQDGLIGC
jgi:hypothetical protein